MKIVSPASLSGAESLVFKNLREWLPANGVCVNIMLGRDPWDVRPLLLANGKVTLYRFSKPLDQSALRELAAEVQGFSVIPGWEMRVEHRDGSDRLLLARPFVQATLADLIAQGEVAIGGRRLELIGELIDVVKTLQKRSLVHGHISPANISETEGGLILLDPRLGSLHSTRDAYLAPEILGGGDPTESSDLFGLGGVISSLLGQDATHKQREIIDRLLLPAPRQRPSVEEVEREFVRSLPPQSRHSLRSGKVIRSFGAPQPGSGQSSSSSSASAPRSSTRPLVACALILMGGALGAHLVFPSVINDIVREIPGVSLPYNAEHMRDWTSGDKALMRIVAQAALERHDLGAENSIIEDTLDGKNRAGVAGNLLRVALADPWRSELTGRDKRAAIALSVVSFYPEGVRTLPPLTTLHSGVLLAILGQSEAKHPSAQFKDLSINRLTGLPGAVGTLFAKLQASGSKDLAAPEVIALAGIVSGNPPAETLESYIQPGDSTAVALGRISIALPLLAANESTAQQLLAILRDRGDDLGRVLGWFDIDTLGLWSKIKSSEKLGLVLGDLPQKGLSVESYADLLMFPLDDLRKKSANELKVRFLKSESDELFSLLSGPQNGLTREQNVALLAALSTEELKRPPYIEILLKTFPSPNMLLLILLARSNQSSTDALNLEISRILRKTNFEASNEMLSLLARHPEPLARSLAYARLSARVPEQKIILQKRLSEESDQNLLRSITNKLSPAPVAPMPTSTTDAQASPSL